VAYSESESNRLTIRTATRDLGDRAKAKKSKSRRSTSSAARVTAAYLPKGKSYTIGLHDVVRMCASNQLTKRAAMWREMSRSDGGGGP
jgi:hypothetical protein